MCVCVIHMCMYIFVNRTDGGHNCVGPEKSSRSCNIQDCPEGSRDFREEQCSQFDGTDFQGKRYKWLPYYGAENPCELNCMPRGENFFYRHRSAVVDGTPCHPGRRDVCVDGVCKRLGCDNMLESVQQDDPCLQCGGNGQSCYRVKNSFAVRDLTTGYNQMFIIPVGATTISIRETVATRNYLAIKNLRGEYYLNGHWVIEFSRATPVAGTVLYYQRGAEGDNVPESIIGRGPTTEPLVVELISQEPNQGVEYEFYLPNGRSREGYYWSFGSWSACSRECGSGYQSRLVFCTIDNEAYPDYLCASLPRPQANRTCNPHPCPQVRSWKTGAWNPCSVTCGGGSQVRSVQCISHDASGPRVVEDAVCAAYAEAPPPLQTCNMHACAEYHVTAWSACSVTCGPGEQSRDVTCTGSGGRMLEEASCGGLLRPAAVQPCTMGACSRQISWHVGEWGLCSRSCSSGSRERQVICSDSQRNLHPVEQCNAHPKPSAVERCNNQPCYSPQGEKDSVSERKLFDSSNVFFVAVQQSICSLPRAAGSCSSWVSRYHFDVITSKCAHFWYGGCHGNNNNFMTRAECQRACPVASLGLPAPPRGPTSTRVTTPARNTPAGRKITPSTVQLTIHGALLISKLKAEDAHKREKRWEVTTLPVVSPGTCPCFVSLTLGGVTIDKTDPSSVEALVGQTVVLPCRVSPPPSSTIVVEWRREGIPLSTHRHHYQPNGSLLVGPLTKLDSGWFLCVATREQERDHRYIYLSVSGNLWAICLLFFFLGLMGAMWGCERNLRLFLVSFFYYRNGVLVRPDGHNILKSSDGSLIINNVKPSDEGTYTCNAYTGIYSVSATAEVKLDSSPYSQSPPLECVDQSELANCKLIVYARLCSNPYYSSFCCASCTMHSQRNDKLG
uniref:Papilin n=1 Tax=Salarias fasciatus TaxID=181472 RepID=A0A672FW37_SALFA